MPETFENRRVALRKLIEQWDGPGALARKLGYRNGSFLIQMAGPNPTREVTEKTARAIEKKLDLPPGFMDGTPSPLEDSNPVDMEIVTECIRMVGEVCEDMRAKFSPAKFAHLVALVYAACVETNHPPREPYVRKLIQLVQKE